MNYIKKNDFCGEFTYQGLKNNKYNLGIQKYLQKLGQTLLVIGQL